jgi:hypothetical protein
VSREIVLWVWFDFIRFRARSDGGSFEHGSVKYGGFGGRLSVLLHKDCCSESVRRGAFTGECRKLLIEHREYLWSSPSRVIR